MADMAGKSMSVDSVAVVHTESVGYTAQAVVLSQGDAPVPVERHFLSLMRPTFHIRISYHSRTVLFLLIHLLFSYYPPAP